MNIKKLIAGLGLLLFASTAQSQNINNPNKNGPLGTQVNTLSGNVFIPRTDVYIPGRGFDLDITFYYNSYFFNQEMGFGKGWSFKYAIKYINDTVPGRKIIFWGDGREDNYDSLPGGNYQMPKGFFSKLVQYQPGKFRLTETDSTTYFFDNAMHKKITRVQEPNGNFINFNYTDSLLTSIVNTAGQTISFTYNTGKLATVVDAVAPLSRTYLYSYDAGGNLIEVTDPLGGKFKYTYLINGPMKTLADKNNNKIDIIYFPDFSARELIGCNKRISFSYDTGYNKTVVTDHFDNGEANQVTTYSYQKLGDLSWLSAMSGNCCGFNMSFEYDDQGNQTKMKDANGNVYEYTYDSKGNMLTTKDPLNQSSTYTYSPNYNKITSYKDPKGFMYTMTYDAKGNLIQLVTPGNNIYTAAYNANGDIISSTDPKGNVFTYNYDAYSNPANVSGPNGYNATLSFDARGNLLAYTDARGNNITAEYDILDRMKKITDPLNNQVQFTYDANGNIVIYKNENNETSQLNYDASDRIVKVTGPTGNQATLSYDAMDNLKTAKNALGFETKFSYDTRNRPISIKDPENNNSQYNYDANGNITSVVMANGQTITYTYDQLNRITAINDNSGTIAALVYDKNNNIISYTNGTGATVSALYDSLDRIKKFTDPLGNSSSYTYDKNDNITSVTDREGRISFYTHDSLNRVKTFTDNNGFVITAGYDATGNVTSLKDQNNNTTTYTYDNLNRRNTMTYPGGTFMQYGYDNKGNLISKRLTDGTTITYQYDTLNRVTNRTLPGGEVYSYSYDKLNRVTEATNNSGTVTFTYDALNRVTSESFDGRTTRYNYNIAGRTQTTIYPDSAKVIKEFDTRNRLIKIMKDSATIVDYAYNNANQLTNKSFANDVNTTMQYDFANRLSSISTGSLQNTSFTYDKEMNKLAITRLNDPSLSEQFTYDNGYRLTNYKRGAVGNPVIQNTYTYDAVGNRTAANLNGSNINYTINSLNQITSTSGGQNVLYNYDGRGNLVYDGIFYKTYDAEGRLQKDSSSPSNVISYSYDAFNRRVTKALNGNPLKYTYSGAAQIEERDGSNLLVNRTVFTNFLSPVLNEKSGNKFYYHQNELNSVEAITNSTGQLTERYQYDVFGKPTMYDSLNNPMLSSAAGNRFGFTGQEYDSASGSYRFFFRNYSPETGVFNQRDLIEYGDGMGMYQYVGNNPVNGVDVWGLQEGQQCGGDFLQGGGKGFEGSGLLLLDGTVETFLDSKIDEITEGIAEKGARLRDLATAAEGDARVNVRKSLDAPKRIMARPGDGLRNLITAGRELTDAHGFTLSANAASNLNTAVSKVGSTIKTGVKVLGKIAIGAVVAETTWNGGKTVNSIVEGDTYGAQMNGMKTIESPLNLLPVYGGVNMFSVLISGNTIVETSELLGEDLKLGPIPVGKNNKAFWEWMYDQDGLINTNHPNYSQVKCNQNGTRKPPSSRWESSTGSMIVITSFDPNEIIGPTGQPNKKWVSVKDRMPYTILCENDKTASAPAKYIYISTPIEPKQDPATFEVGGFGFNNQEFTVPQGLSSYYQRLDCRDSMGLFVDVVAGYDQIRNEAFWNFQSIDPVTLLPTEEPLAGLLFLQDTLNPNYGHGYVTFSIKPRANALTLDTIGAKAKIMFDQNDTIPTNIYTNTIDAFAPTSQMNALLPSGTNPITLSWSGTDDLNGCGIDYYTVYVSSDMINYSILIPKTSRTDTTISLPGGANYCFFVLATDRVGNTETLRPGVTTCSSIGTALPVTWLYFNGTNIGKDNLLKWATASEQNSKEFRVERSLNGTNYSQIGVVAAAGNATTTSTYQHTDYRIDQLNSPVMFYRLKQVDMDNNFKYSNIIRLNYNKAGTVPTIVYPNPTNSSVTITVGDDKLIGTEAVLSDVNGRILQRIKITATSQFINMDRLVNGIYFIRLTNNETLKVVKQ